MTDPNELPPPLARYGGKSSEDWRYYANDFLDHRLVAWTSIFFQCRPIAQRGDVESVLEFGGGRDVTRALSRHLGLTHVSVDLQERFYPDHRATILDHPFDGRQYDMVCSFQCLEHNPPEELETLIGHMRQFTRKYLYLSVPYGGAWVTLFVSLRLPRFSWTAWKCLTADFLGGRRIDTAPFRALPDHRRHAPHWWEAGRPGLRRRRLVERIEAQGLRLIDSRHNPFFPHHLFLLFERTDSPAATVSS